jgi:hypothetical protein
MLLEMSARAKAPLARASSVVSDVGRDAGGLRLLFLAPAGPESGSGNRPQQRDAQRKRRSFQTFEIAIVNGMTVAHARQWATGTLRGKEN